MGIKVGNGIMSQKRRQIWAERIIGAQRSIGFAREISPGLISGLIRKKRIMGPEI